MRRHLLSLALLLAAAGAARADSVVLRGGGTIENVRAKAEGDHYRLVGDKGSILIPKDDVSAIIPQLTAREEIQVRRREAGEDPAALRKLAQFCRDRGYEAEDRELRAKADRIDRDRHLGELGPMKRAAGEDPEALRKVAAWAESRGLADERDGLLDLARGIELDRRLAALEKGTSPEPFLELAREMNRRGWPEAEKRVVLEKALARDPEHPVTRDSLGFVKRDGRWITKAESARLDAEAEERAMRARGLVKHEGRWMAPETIALIEERRALERERGELRRERERLQGDLAKVERARNEWARAQREASERAAAEHAERLRTLEAESVRLAAERRAAAAESERLANERRALEDARRRLQDERRRVLSCGHHHDDGRCCR